MSDQPMQRPKLPWWCIETTGRIYTTTGGFWKPIHIKNLAYRIWMWYLKKRGY